MSIKAIEKYNSIIFIIAIVKCLGSVVYGGFRTAAPRIQTFKQPYSSNRLLVRLDEHRFARPQAEAETTHGSLRKCGRSTLGLASVFS